MFAKNLEIGDLVWAKMKNFPYWPAKIVPPLETKSSSPKKSEHYVYFFGSENHAWILDEHIVLHSEDMINSCKKKRASLLFQNAIDEIVKAALEENSKPKEKIEIPNAEYCDDLSEASTASEPKKEKVRKIKNKNAIVKAPKRRLSYNEKSDDSLLSHVPKFSKLIDDLPSAVSVGATTADGSRIAVIRPFDDASSIVISPKYIDRPITPLLDIATVDPNVKTEHVKPTDKKIGFLGLGMMGRGIVKNLLKSGHHVIIWNRSPGVCDDFIKAGAIKVQLPSDVVVAADIIFCCVSDSEAVKTIVFGLYGVLHGLKVSTGRKGYVEMSSIDADTSQEIAEAINNKGGKYLETPIIGNRQLAEEGYLTILASGDRGLFNDCETCFHAMSRHAYYVSCEVGESSKFSLILSMLMGTVCGALAEALALAKCIHVSQKELLEVLQLNGLTSAMVLDKGRAILDQNFSANTPLKHQQKDVNLALCMSDVVGQPMPVSASANELYKHAKLLGYSEHDMAAVYQGAKY